MSPSLYSDLQQMNLRAVACRLATNILLIDSGQNNENAGLRDHLSKTTPGLEYQSFQAPQIWQPTTDGSLLVPAQVLQAIAGWAARTHL
jgi:hypothetical protein